MSIYWEILMISLALHMILDSWSLVVVFQSVCYEPLFCSVHTISLMPLFYHLCLVFFTLGCPFYLPIQLGFIAVVHAWSITSQCFTWFSPIFGIRKCSPWFDAELFQGFSSRAGKNNCLATVGFAASTVQILFCSRSHIIFLYSEGAHALHISFTAAESILPLICSPIVWPKQPKNKPKFEFLNLILKLILKCF